MSIARGLRRNKLIRWVGIVMFLVYHKLNSARHLHREGFLHPLNQLDNSGNELGNLNTAGYI